MSHQRRKLGNRRRDWFGFSLPWELTLSDTLVSLWSLGLASSVIISVPKISKSDPERVRASAKQSGERERPRAVRWDRS